MKNQKNVAKNYKTAAELPRAIQTSVSYTDEYKGADGYRAIINPDNNHLFSIVSPKYSIVNHSDVLAKIDEVLNNHPEYGTPCKTIKTYKDDARMQAKYTFKDITVSVKDADNIHPSIEIRNGYDGLWGFGVLFGAFRLVCTNGLVIGQKVLQFKKKHYNPAQDFFHQDILSDALEQFSMQTDIWKTWVDKVIEQNEIESNLIALELREKEIEEVKALTEMGSAKEGNPISILTAQVMTQWLFFNILAQYITHNVKNVNRQIALEANMRKMF